MKQVPQILSTLVFKGYFLFTAALAWYHLSLGSASFFKNEVNQPLWAILLIGYSCWLIILGLTKTAFMANHLKGFIPLTVIVILSFVFISIDSIQLYGPALLTLAVSFIYFYYLDITHN